jgi:hypothetical protein
MSNTEHTLRGTIEEQAKSSGRSLGDLTVMSSMTDPYRIDTPANRRDAQWLAAAWATSVARRPLHLRGLHYALVSVAPPIKKPDGGDYLNTDDDWTWLQAVAGKARWLGFIEFEDISDERNAAPSIYTGYNYSISPSTYIMHSARGVVTPFDEMLPSAGISQKIRVSQAYRLVLIGEKTSLASVLDPLARRYSAELILPTGELSTTLLYGIAKRAHQDGRPCRIFYFSDFDPSGYHMPIEVSRKLQALSWHFFRGLDLQMHRCALTFEQVRELRLPGTPLKETERRADKWRERWGVEQTEIDALATLQPDALRVIAEEALQPYWDDSLDERAADVENHVLSAAEESIEREIEARRDEIERARIDYGLAAAEVQRLALNVIEPLFAEIVETARLSITPRIEVPQADPAGDIQESLFDSTGGWLEQTERLIAARL